MISTYWLVLIQSHLHPPFPEILDSVASMCFNVFAVFCISVSLFKKEKMTSNHKGVCSAYKKGIFKKTPDQPVS